MFSLVMFSLVMFSLGERRRGDLPVVERQHRAGHVLAGLVPLAGHHDDIARRRQRDRLGDRGAPVRFDDHPGSFVLRHAQHAIQHRREYRQRVLRTRIVASENGHVGQGRGRGAHHRALGPVPVATTAEHDDQVPLSDGPQRPQHRLDRARLVRVVDEGGNSWDGPWYPLQPSGHARARRYARHRVVKPDARLDQGDQGTERVGDVEHPGQADRHVGLDPARTDQPERTAIRARTDVYRPPVGLRGARGRERGDRHGRRRGKPAPVPVVDVHHPDHGRDEQRRLGPEVILQIGMEVQMILRQVGEDRHVEAGARHPAQAERVA